MSEPKRVQFETNGVKKLSSDSSAAEARKTIRLELNFATAKSYPQFNYLDLVAAEKKKKKIPQLNGFGSSPFDDNAELNDDDVKRAQEFERKYGNAYQGAGPSIRRMNQSICDKGSGYDQSDPFIDDAIKYDEHVPDEMDTDHGGFYINSGPLQFKKLANFERPEDAQRMPKPRKRAISSASSDSNESNRANATAENVRNGQPDKKLKLSNEKDKNVVLNKENIKSKCMPTEEVAIDLVKDAIAKKEKTTTVKDMLRAKRDSMRTTDPANGIKSCGQPMATTTEDSSSSDDTSDSSDDEDDDDEDNINESDANGVIAAKISEKIIEKPFTIAVGTKNLPTPVNETNGEPVAVEQVEVKLPDNLPDNFNKKIKQLVEVAKTKSKINLFDNETIELLHEMDALARISNVQQIIYKYLAPQMGCSLQTITNKAKKIRIEKEEQQVKPLYERLKREIDLVMPAVINAYEISCNRVSELKAAAAANKEPDRTEQTFKNPRRKFPWNGSLRKIMEDIVTLRRQSYKRIGIRRCKEHEYIESYLKDELCKLWPENWMKFDELRREFMKDVRKPKENKKPTDKMANPSSKLPTTTTATAKKPKPTTMSSVTANNNIVKVNAIDSKTIEKSANKAIAVKSEKKLIDITSKVTGASTIPATSSATTAPTDMKSTISNKIMKSSQDQQVINFSTAALSAKQSNSNSTNNNSSEIGSSPEHSSSSKKASDHSINHIISLPPSSNNSKVISSTKISSNASNNAYDTIGNVKSKCQSSKPLLNSNIIRNRSKDTSIEFKIKIESPEKIVHIIKDSSSDDEVQIIDDKPKHIAIASSSVTSNVTHVKTNKNKRDKINSNNIVGASTIKIPNAQRIPKSILKTSHHSPRDPLTDDDILNAQTTMNALKELEPRRNE